MDVKEGKASAGIREVNTSHPYAGLDGAAFCVIYKTKVLQLITKKVSDKLSTSEVYTRVRKFCFLSRLLCRGERKQIGYEEGRGLKVIG